MAHVQSTVAPHAVASFKKGVSNLLNHVAAAIEEANMRCAEREIAQYLGGDGAKFTDESERKIERFLQHRNW
jgi:hypothetical protein